MNGQQAFIALMIALISLFLTVWIFKTSYNFAVVDGISIDPKTGAPRLNKINMQHSFVLVVFISMFFVPSCYQMSK